MPNTHVSKTAVRDGRIYVGIFPKVGEEKNYAAQD